MFRVAFRLSRISIVHLCVSDNYRGKNVSTALFKALKENLKRNIVEFPLVVEQISHMRLTDGEN